MATRFQILAVRVVAAGTCVILAKATARGAEPLPLDVFVHGDVRVDPQILAGARQTVARIFNRLDVHIAWLDPPGTSPTDAPDDAAAQRALLRSAFTVRLVATTSTNRENVPSARALGFAMPGTHVASVILPRVEQLARQSDTDLALVLGHVMAHELGHLLLRQSAHSVAGLMQAELDTVLARQGRLLFSDSQAQAIRAVLSKDAYPRPTDTD